MKKVIYGLLFSVLFLSGCAGNESNTIDSSIENSSVPKSSETNLSESASYSSETDENVITKLNIPGEIKYDEKTVYTIEITEIKDVTEKAKSDKTNSENNLDFFSNGQANQAVRVTVLMKNLSGESLGMPYLDNQKIVDELGVNSVGGWKDQGGSIVEFGFYDLDENGNTDPNIYQINDGEAEMATSTVLLANPSKSLKLTFSSDKYKSSIEFDIPIEK
ncbi:hypothetical protein [Enterococcus casseliflavus]|uniref:hypothetical protein n=1 Tax=Enterococcus casseliflavus TaxID=37734 RepID=UPI0035CB6E56